MKKIEIMGCGYIGLPTAITFTLAGYEVCGFDVKPSVVESLNHGKIHIVEPNLQQAMDEAMATGRLHFTTKPREEIEAHITPRTRAMLFTNPNNPTGVVMSNEELRMLADVAKEHELFLIADEVYREFVYEGEIPMSVGAFEDLAENAIIIDSVSKRFSACGARVGCIVSRNHQLHEQLAKLSQARLSVATIDQVGATALYNIQGDYFAETRDEYRRRRGCIQQL